MKRFGILVLAFAISGLSAGFASAHDDGDRRSSWDGRRGDRTDELRRDESRSRSGRRGRSLSRSQRVRVQRALDRLRAGGDRRGSGDWSWDDRGWDGRRSDGRWRSDDRGWDGRRSHRDGRSYDRRWDRRSKDGYRNDRRHSDECGVQGRHSHSDDDDRRWN